MPIKKAAMKAMRQDKKRAQKNRDIKETIEYLRRMHRKALEAGDQKKADALVKDIVRAVDKAAQIKVLKKNTAARIKSRLTKKRASAAPVAAKKKAAKK
jgi:small subunit ribosomal protein S20